MKRIAIIGTGISGLTCAHYLHSKYDITLFEANDYIGGHTATKEVSIEGDGYLIDTGFIVFNNWTYPEFNKIIEQLDVEYLDTEMGFSVSCEQSGLEYSGGSLSSLFTQRKNIFNWRHWKMIADIIRFNQQGKKDLSTGQLDESISLGEYLDSLNLSQRFADKYLVPMGAAIWSCGLQEMLDFPARYFLQFFANHGLLNVGDRPQWRVIKNGSQAYVDAMIKPFKDKILLNTPVRSVMRGSRSVKVATNDKLYDFDEVIFACHSDQALALIDDPGTSELEVLSQLNYQSNEVVLHTDKSLLPKSQRAWSSWNYRIKKEATTKATLTYNMNILQRIESIHTFCVTLNDTDSIDPDKILGTYHYDHPVYNRGTLEAQQSRHKINGVNRLWFCGAYWYAGFHEDGVRSALDVVNALDSQLESESHSSFVVENSAREAHCV
ncbi:NAD(P)/FAD-dependent oxidoreductase [Pleionea sp. CnH1-48]|uniref:NAD(P)/FAD-dependent oxidoreductase n=1 Tax=Pleionea sp. CnH1-48 TaxID=2954494 RepID=UPI0020973EFA|nr:FAD-dependent oxidoreductase [Pleionea sp. CnH1-48]MCO7226916.1 FAD-dependent oxidoreductase [Pleionea sp. CnH1-48]